MNSILSCLSLVTSKLNEANIKYGIGGSLLLYSYGLVSTCNDIDILFNDKDYEAVKNLFVCDIYYEKQSEHPLYKTSHMIELKINGIEIDMMFDFKIAFDEYSYVYKLLTNKRLINGVIFDFSLLEDWYLIYQLISGREEKVKLIEDYFLTSKNINFNQYHLLIDSQIPNGIRARMTSLVTIITDHNFDF
ncbi:MAG: hypothetical protein PHC62_08135 [Candidatus Izemoplasmatales bacterium]|nr:hypothetical protein [Candidatus Izemoplasmatales bacterium]